MLPADAWAQGTAQISGTAKDQSGAVLPGVEITATQTDTGVSRNTVTDERGAYTLPSLPVGPYRLEATLPGFRTFAQTGIVLQVNSNSEIAIVLEVGQVAERVEVQANVTQVETRSLSVREVIETQQILELPLNGRAAQDLLVLAGATVAQGTNSSREIGGGRGYSVMGLQNTSVTYTLDGAMHNNPYNNLNLPAPFPDALQEFSIQTGTQNAQNGFLGGAQVGAVTRSGTNEFHGAVFDFVRNDRFKARGYFDTTKGTQKRNQFGGTLGGPIVRQKLFFFAGFQSTLNRQNPDQDEDYVPTARMLQGDFSEAVKLYVDPNNRDLGGCRTTVLNATGTGATPGLLRAPFESNRVNPALFSKAALNLASKLPKPIDECGLVRHSVRNQSDSHEINGKVDYNVSAKHSVFGRLMVVPESRAVPHNFNPDNLLNVGAGGADNLGSFYTIGDTYLISPVTINAARLAVNRTAIHRVGPDFFNITELGLNAYSYLPKHTQLSVTGGNGFSLGGGTESEATFKTTTYQLSDDINMVRGSHQLSVGGTLSHWRSNSYANVRSTGIYGFNGDVTGLGMADFLLGRPNSLRQAVPNQLTMSQWYVGLYVQDAWRITPRFFVTAGLRWEPYFPQQQRDGHIYNFDYDRMLTGVKTSQFLKASPGFYYPGDPGFPGKAGLYKNWKALGPRFGLGWDPQGDGKTSVRAGYGISYDFVNAQYHLNTNIAPPFGNDLTITPASFDDPWANYPGGNPFPPVRDKNAPFNLAGAFLSMPYDIATTYVQTWNLTVQRQLPRNLFFSVAYNGNGTRHLWSTYPLNPATYIPGSNCTLPNGRRITGTCSTTTASNVNERRLLSLANYDQVGQYVAALDSYDDGGTASYHGLTLTLNRRATRYLNVTSNYTWSHCIGADGTAGTTVNVNTGSVFTQIIGGRSYFVDRRADVANCGNDRRHLFNSTAVFEMPRFQNRIVSWLASGWRVANIYRRQSGGFFNVTAGTDAAISRVFQINENQEVEFRVEAYNVPNSFRAVNPVTGINSSDFGLITGSRATRDMQFALKYKF
ncbi:MAG: TonB-dependent receptor [Acidobacteria bacterium]|nr:TonB-dependent receptor [Acidobacteriota bacterium]